MAISHYNGANGDSESRVEDRRDLEDLLKSFVDTFVGPLVDSSKASRLGSSYQWL